MSKLISHKASSTSQTDKLPTQWLRSPSTMPYKTWLLQWINDIESITRSNNSTFFNFYQIGQSDFPDRSLLVSVIVLNCVYLRSLRCRHITTTNDALASRNWHDVVNLAVSWLWKIVDFGSAGRASSLLPRPLLQNTSTNLRVHHINTPQKITSKRNEKATD